MSLTSVLETGSAPSARLWGYDRSLFGAFDGFADLGDDIRRQIYHSPADLPSDAPLVMGHFARSTLRSAFEPGRFLTVLREPTTRLLSHWLYWRRLPDADLEGWAGWRHAIGKALNPLAEFLTDPSIAAQTDNLMTRALLWPHPLVPNAGFIDPRHDRRIYREARAHLRTFDFVDLVENPAFPERLGAWLGRRLALPTLNETAWMPPSRRVRLASELSDQAHALLQARSRIDLRLWSELAAPRAACPVSLRCGCANAPSSQPSHGMPRSWAETSPGHHKEKPAEPLRIGGPIRRHVPDGRPTLSD